MRYLFIVIVTLGLYSCASTTKDNTTYFGGEIINPKTNFVLFLKDDIVLDTLQLDNNHKFLGSFKNLSEGLYTFKHGLEFQYIYLQPKDSILVRLNTWDFDESLVFSGKGSGKNEFLINLFLQDEKEEKNMFSYFNLSDTAFEAKIDSLSKERMAIYKTFTENEIEIPDGFKKITDVTIHYPLYRLKEIYPYFNKKALGLTKFPKVSENFYAFRKNINLNEENLVSFYPYQNYVVSYLYNLSYQQKEQDSTKNNITINILNAINQNIDLESFKNTLLKRIVVRDFLMSDATCGVNEDVFKIFLNSCTDEHYLTQVKNLVSDSKIIKNNSPLENFDIISTDSTTTSINTVIKNKNAVIYFWTREFMSSEYLVKRINYLEKNYPDVLFIGINMESSFDDLTKEPNLKKLETSKQFILTNQSIAHNFLTSNYPRTIIVTQNGIVQNGFTYLDSKILEQELHKFKNN